MIILLSATTWIRNFVNIMNGLLAGRWNITDKNCLWVQADSWAHPIKVKFLPITDHEGPEGEQMYSSTLPSTSALGGVGGQCHAPAALPPGKDPVSTVQEAGWAPGPVWTGAENLFPTGIRLPDRPARSESLYRLSYPGPPEPTQYPIQSLSGPLRWGL